MTWYNPKKTSEIPMACRRRLQRIEHDENRQQLDEICRPNSNGQILRAVLGRIVERLGEDRVPDSYEEAHGF